MGAAGKIIVKAFANGKVSEKSFVVMVTNEEIAFGKEFMIKDVFENQDDVNTHRAVLDGDCTITGYNGYSNHAFFNSVSDSDSNEVIAYIDADINDTFPAGIYSIGASLSYLGTSYSYNQDEINYYQLTISCPNADDSTAGIAGLLGIDLSGTFMSGVIPGNVNNDNTVDLTDAIICLQFLAGITSLDIREDYPSSGTDVNSDGKIGLQEAVYILQYVAGLRH